MTAFLGLIAGLGMLVGGGYVLVMGASGLAARFRLPPVMVGLTIVAFGTSAPELFVGIMAGLRDHTDIVFGNVIGSNIANIGLVLGLAAVIRPIEISGQIVRREIPLLLLATAVILTTALDPLLRGSESVIDYSDAAVLLLLFLVFFYVIALDVLRSQDHDSLMLDIDTSPMIHTPDAGKYHVLFIITGLGGLLYGGHLTIENAVVLAELLHISSTIVGLFVVAIGTSLPELVTTVIAAIRREPDLALGNVIGSNLFNGLAVLPVSALMAPVTLPEGGIFDLSVSFLFALALIPIFWMGKARLGRRMGWLFLGLYAIYALVRVL